MSNQDLISRAGQPVDDDTLRKLSVMLWEMRDLGGPGSGNFDHAGRPGQVGGSSDSMSRAERAKASHVPATRAAQRMAFRSEQAVAKAIGGEDTDDQLPMDVIIKAGSRTIGVEVKTILRGKHDKITMHVDSLARKHEWLRKNRATGHTVAIDRRGTAVTYYYARGFGSFRLTSMQKVSLSQLHDLVRQ